MNASRSVNPFVSSPHGHPSFNPVKLGTKGTVSVSSSQSQTLSSNSLYLYMFDSFVHDSVEMGNYM